MLMLKKYTAAIHPYLILLLPRVLLDVRNLCKIISVLYLLQRKNTLLLDNGKLKIKVDYSPSKNHFLSVSSKNGSYTVVYSM